MKDLKEIQKFITERSCEDKHSVQRIINKHFQKIPKNVKLLQKHQFATKKVLEIGACKGNSFLHWGRDSEAIELDPKSSSFLRSLNFKVHELNVEDDFHLKINNKYDAIYTNNLFEHITSPHLFLLKIYTLLNVKGVLAIGFPIVPSFPFNFIYRIFNLKGWLASEHINFFTIKTARLVIERSGFDIIDYHIGPLSYFPLSNILKRIFPFMGFSCLFICKKKSDFNLSSRGVEVYPSNQTIQHLFESEKDN